MPKKTGLTGVDVFFKPRAEAVPAAQPEVRIRTSVYLDPEDVVILDELQTLEFQRLRRRSDRSELIRKALRLYHQSLKSS